MPPTVSTRKGIEATWSRCEWVMKIWSICESSASVRSPTPVPQSMRMSLSTRNDVVRRWRPPIPPEQPRTRKRMAGRSLLFVEHPHALPARGGRRAPEFRRIVGVQLVQLAAGIHALQVDQVDLDLVPLLLAEGTQRLMPELDQIELAVHHVGHQILGRLAHQDADAIELGAALQAGREIHRVAHGGVGLAHLGAHVADAHRAGI